MTVTTRRCAAVLVAAALALGGCGGSDGGSRPSVDELTQAIRGGSSGLGVPAADAECVAKLLVESDLSDAALRRYTGDNDADELNDADDKAFDKVLGRLGDCGVTTGAV